MAVTQALGRLLGPAWTVFLKEMTEALRDRRTVALGLAVPVILMPAVTLGLPALAAREEARLQAAPARVAVRGAEHLAPFLQQARAQGALVVVSAPDPLGALRAGRVDAVLEAAPAEGAVRVRVLYQGTSVASVLARQKVAEALARYSLEAMQARLAALGLAAETLLPLQVEVEAVGPTVDTARAALATVLPFFIAVWMVLGGQYAALDLGAGEAERGTLAALLLTPPPRLALVLGKFGTVLLLAVCSVALVVGAVLATLRVGGTALGEAATSLPPTVALALLAAGLPLAGFLTAVQLLLSLVARSVREAQLLFTPLYLAVAASVILAQLLPEWGRQVWVYALPFLNGGYLLRGVVLGTVGGVEVGLAVASLLLATGLVLSGAAAVYRREQVVWGS